ncbi:hypothetical protein TSUD_164310 [Trifolium subterraneum]|uniref:F-box domain-containing protein n=1 Tax=Trifolium subterraneum TaxID=3900 RepID=A0A2Z6MQP5_TRISU|nr:hypothetical protein TSUD_164310 [Trifolium subterraneum]
MAQQDIISTLPDAILCHILSFLQTKHAVATTILSKRWKHLCHSVPVLCFDTTVTNQKEYIRFINFVYSVLLSRDPAFPINTFHLDFTYYEYELHYPMDTITKWVKFVAQRGLHYLDLHVNRRSSLDFTELPVTIINYKTLVVLKLHSFSMEETSSPVDLPSLKTLDLDEILCCS